MSFLISLPGLLRRLAAGLVLGALAALPAAAQPAAPQKIVFGFSASTAFANAFVAANEGIFKKHGLDVEMKLVPNSATTPAALMAGSLQVATPTAPNTMQAVEQGLDLVVIAGGGYYTKGMEDVAIMVRPDSPIKTAKDFEGKRVSTPGLNAFLHVLFRKWMSENGGDWRKVTFTENAFAQSIDVLRAGQVDGILAVQPFLSRALETNTGRVVAYYIAALDGEIQSGWHVASRKWAEANPKAVAAFKASIEEASALAAKDPSVVRKANLVYIPFPADVQAKFPDPKFKPVITPDVVDRWNKIMAEQGMLKKPVEPAKLLVK
ncbi:MULTISPECIES: ABC transporter substrate-binding protein [Ramlibacter]|uniref:Metal ABC transporter substrate-binding protein n=1 Tax=Ramlibacter pinisoli TaxID=2682844 RepID=A0A6N8J377_9BURK|nr:MULTISPECIES: ABC transporter substrate-binding protein [Ramlibacter]MBA2962771.1 ABC transporter substrate-binding protein [Ramlibacter sp. CGMCC 1.13660]MVQ32713.1 metal ABC transporter substrate-binding protein [Ramlibacter pinisoli]